MTRDRPTVSIVTVNFNGYKYTEKCLESLERLDYPRFEVIVVDNGSTEKADWSRLQEQYPSVIFIFSKDNLGFAGGNNLGLDRAEGRFVWLLNNDTEPEPDSLSFMVETMLSSPKIGMVSSRLLYFEPRGLVQYAGATDLNPITMRNRSLGYKETMKPEFAEVYPTSYIHGASVLVRSEAIDKVGRMHDFFFLYYEEYDWCYRFRSANYEVFYDGRAVVYHKESAVTVPDSPLKTYYLLRNRILFIRLNYKGVTRWLSLGFTTFIAAPKAILVNLLKGKFKNVQAIFKGLSWNLKHPNTNRL
ncbi:MAG: glycosyltransferase family 2 protein [Flavobacteriia bacterium]|nr:glycosyltransferase family 2 protein [Flavobacteriia bacterium]